jgi:hypothetical protein
VVALAKKPPCLQLLLASDAGRLVDKAVATKEEEMVTTKQATTVPVLTTKMTATSVTMTVTNTEW